MAADIHIYIQDAFQEARNLRMTAYEISQNARTINDQIEELMSVWRGASATRVAAAMLGRSTDASKLSNNLNVLADGLYRTAMVYQQAQKDAGQTIQTITPGKPSLIHINYVHAGINTGGSSGGGHSSGGGRHAGR